jgi:P-type Cu2+ transporter
MVQQRDDLNGRPGHGKHDAAAAPDPHDTPDAHDDTPDAHDDTPDAHDDRGGHAGHGGHDDHAAQFRDRFWLTVVLSVPVVVWAPMIQEWFGYTAPAVPGESLIAPVLGSIIFFYGGWPFLT